MSERERLDWMRSLLEDGCLRGERCRSSTCRDEYPEEFAPRDAGGRLESRWCFVCRHREQLATLLRASSAEQREEPKPVSAPKVVPKQGPLIDPDRRFAPHLRATSVGQQDGLTALCEDAGPLGSAACMIRRGELDGVRITLEVSEVAALARWLREPDYRHFSPVSPPAKSSDYANLRAIANEALANMEALVQRLAGAEYDALFVRPSDSDNPEPTVFAGEIWDVHPKSRTVSIKPDALPPEFWNSGTAPIGARVTVFVSEVQPTSSAGGSE